MAVILARQFRLPGLFSVIRRVGTSLALPRARPKWKSAAR